MSRQFGLNIKKKEETKIAPRKLASVFGDDDDEEHAPATASNAASASVIRVQKAAEREHQKAEAEDPTIFDYDGNYDEIQAIKNEKKEEARKADSIRESKYAHNIIQAHQRRELERFSREERQQMREREKEGDEFADKEVFVTGAYRQQQEEVKKHREQEAEEHKLNELTSVQKQKMWEAGIGRTLLNDIARDPTAFAKRKQKNNLRKREDPEEQKGAEPQKEPKKSIYSDEEEEPLAPPPPKPKNFEGELKPGLNKVIRKETKAERIQRNFTPTPPTSDDEQEKSSKSSRRVRSSRSPRSRSSEKGAEPEDVKPEIRKLSLKEKLKPKRIDKVARLEGLKEILKQRNTEKEIQEARERYLERKEQRIVVPPL